ncbi:MAG: branched-chain amino acid ABC transporter permease [Spirochaetaceae bacterium]|nr:branched-chain amino acid ABC transporter permease [Spirochaetaceae bacterium]
MDTLLQLLTRGLETGSIYALTALGIVLIFKTNGTVNFAQGTIGMFCTYTATWIFAKFGAPVAGSVVGAVAAALAIGVFMDIAVIRHTAKVGAVGKQIITLGFFMMILGITPMVFGINLLSLPKLVQGNLELAGGIAFSANGFLNIIIGVAITLALFLTLQKTKLGLAVRATAMGESTARMLGIPTKTVTMFAWACACALSALSGVMIAPSTTVSLTVMDAVLSSAFLSCFFGGYQTFHGPVIAAFIIGIAKNLIVYYWSSVWGELMIYIVVFVFIVFRPNGLIGKAPVKKV